ncbi:MAG: TetR/AcrR family transcriptional regulator [Halioglobus sp.]
MARPAYSQEQKLEIETSIRETALKLFSQEGYRSVSLRAIAREMELSATALYRYFDNKDALLAAIRAEGFQQLREQLNTVRNNAASGLEAAREGIIGYISFGLEKPELYSLMYELDQRDFEETPLVFESRRRAFAEAEAIAKDMLKEGGQTGNANQMAHLFWISAHGLVALAVANQLDLGQDLDQLIEPVLQSTLLGITHSQGD